MTMAAVVAARLRALLDDDPGLAVVAPAEHPLADSEGAAGRVVTAPPTVRAALAAGLCTTGRAVASVWEPGEDARAGAGVRTSWSSPTP